MSLEGKTNLKESGISTTLVLYKDNKYTSHKGSCEEHIVIIDRKCLAQYLAHSMSSVNVGPSLHLILFTLLPFHRLHSFFSKDMQGACPPSCRFHLSPAPRLFADWFLGGGAKGRAQCGAVGGAHARVGLGGGGEEELPEVGGGGGGRAVRSCQGNPGGKRGGQTLSTGGQVCVPHA